jgi:peptidyl-prolyl cis-trans isomerase C
VVKRTPYFRRLRSLPAYGRIGVPCLVVFALACASDPGQPQDRGATHGAAAASGRVLAEVNGVPILARQVERIWEADRLRLGAEGQSSDEMNELEIRREALQLAVNAELCYQAARDGGMTVSAEELDERIEGIRSQFASEEEFASYLEEGGLNLAMLRERVARRTLVESYARSISAELVLDEAAAKRIYQEQKDRFREAEKIRAAHIIVRALPHDPEAKHEAARKKIEDAQRKLQAGEDFARVAEQYSESPFASRGGDLGFFPRGRALPEFDAVVFDTPVGEITPVFETPHGFNIVKVLDRREGGVSDFEEVKTGLLMVLAREQKHIQLREHIEELRAAATIRVLDPELQPAAVE